MPPTIYFKKRTELSDEVVGELCQLFFLAPKKLRDVERSQSSGILLKSFRLIKFRPFLPLGGARARFPLELSLTSASGDVFLFTHNLPDRPK